MGLITILIFLLIFFTTFYNSNLKFFFSDRFREISIIYIIVLSLATLVSSLRKKWEALKPKNKNSDFFNNPFSAVFLLCLCSFQVFTWSNVSFVLIQIIIGLTAIVANAFLFFSNKRLNKYFSYSFYNYFNLFLISYSTYSWITKHGNILWVLAFFVLCLFIKHFKVKELSNLSFLLKNFFQGTSIKVIPISLAQDDISDNSVLKYIANQAYNKYKEYLRPFDNTYRFFYQILVLIIIYSSSLVIFYYSPTFSIANNLRIETGISNYLPSQVAYYYQEDPSATPYRNILDLFDKIAKSKKESKDDKLHSKFQYFLGSSATEFAETFQLTITDSIQKNVSNLLSDSLLFKTTDIGFDLFRYCEIVNSLTKIDTSNGQINNNKGVNYDLTINKSKYQRFILSNYEESEARFLEHYINQENYGFQPDSSSQAILNSLFPFTNIEDSKSLANEIYANSKKRFYSNYIKVAVVYLDYLIFEYYGEFAHIFFRSGEVKDMDKMLVEGFQLSPRFHIIPLNFDYFFFLYLFAILCIYQIVVRTGWLFTSHYRILLKFRRLIDNINSEVIENQNFGIGNAFGIFRRKNYPKYETRDIENELISIFAEMDRVPKVSLAPKFVFVFDELDKIEQKPMGSIEESTTEISYVLSEGLRKRQATVSKLLANLKHFFNVTKAKFIFIAGREMYDAAMADISDRDSFLGSIFHDVIYIDSFYKDHLNEKEDGISTLTEAYICQFLHHEGEKKLTSLNQYYNLKHKEFNLSTVKKGRDLKDLQKSILVLYDFTNYLTYRSNGSPKKLTKLFEEYITPLEPEYYDETKLKSEAQKEFVNQNIIIGEENSQNLYLKFAFYDQYIFGFTSSVFNPFMFKLNKHTKDYSDKLLVSTSFLIDHVFKFHGIGFSFSNLELTPEIVAVNKAPELRSFINRIIRFYKNIFIREILSGLHEFKFNSRIEREIRYISTISDRESAAFNFTLDESFQLKTYYINLLKEQNKFENERAGTNEFNSNFTNQRSKTDILHILGDLYYNDEELDDALRYYLDALDNCLQIETHQSEFRQTNLIEIITSKLKLGLTYERKHSFDQALMEYESLTQLILQKANKLNAGFPFEKGKETYNLFTGLRISFQSLLAELQVLEKNAIKSLTAKSLEINNLRFQQLIIGLEKTQSVIIEAEYYDKVGDILFYKNGPLFTAEYPRENKVNRYFYKAPNEAYIYYRHSLRILQNRIIDGLNNHVSIEDTRQFVKLMKGNYLHGEVHTLNKLTAYILDSSNFDGYKAPSIKTNRKSVLESFANVISDLGDCLLCFPSETRTISLTNINNVLNFRYSKKNKPNNDKEISFISTTLNEYETAIYCYSLSSMYNAQAGEIKEYCFQLTKVLYLIKDALLN